MQHELCIDCESRTKCKQPCRSVDEILWHENRVMERHYQDRIVCYPLGKEIHFSELPDGMADEFSTDDAIQFNTGQCRLTKTAVFIDRFFNKVPCKDLADRFGVKENTIVCMYKQAVEQLERLIETLDMRKAGIKAMKPEKFTDDQKFFLLAHVFGFSQVEVARMFNRDKNMINQKVKRMADRYAAAFEDQGTKEETLIEDPPMVAKLTRARVVEIVEAYTEQGLSHSQAFKRIAGRYAEIVNRPVNYRGIESRYYKAMAVA